VEVYWFLRKPEAWKRKESWSLLRHLRSFEPRAWLCVGDYNEILEESEKRGGVPRARWQMSDFQQTMDYCQLMDLGFVGAPFTWCNNRESDDYVKERLDRATANADWWYLFPVRRVEILAAQCSDHAPIQILFSRSAKDGRRRHMRFRYEAGWQKNKNR
jgi:hypothetical protein